MRSAKLLRIKLKAEIRTRQLSFALQQGLAGRMWRAVARVMNPAIRRSLAMFFIVGVVVVGIIVTAQTIRAATASVTMNTNDLLEGSYEYGSISIDKKAGTMALQKGEVGSWAGASDRGVVTPPFGIIGTSNMVYGPNDTLYVLGDNNQQCSLSKYEIETKQWTMLRTPPMACGQGNTQLIYDQDGSLYYLAGGSQYNHTAYMFRYDIRTDAWIKLAGMPTTLSNVTSATFAKIGNSQYIYVIRGTQIPVLWQYSIQNNTWSMMSSYSNTTSVASGLMITWDGGSYLYGLVSATGEFKRYNIGLDVWTSLATVNGVSERRSSLLYADGIIYDFRTAWRDNENRSANLNAYDIAKDIWTSKGTVPGPSQEYSHPIAYAYDGKQSLFALIGYGQLMNVYRYDIGREEWVRSSLLDTSSGRARTARTPISAGNGTVYYTGGWDGHQSIYKYTYHDDNSFTIKSAPAGATADVLVVGGGGGGGGNAYAGGGGGGGVVYSEQYPLESSKKYTVSVGDGGSSGFNYQRAQNGEASRFEDIYAIGGGGGGSLGLSADCVQSKGRDGSGGGGASRYFVINACGADGFGIGLDAGSGNGGILTYYGRNRGGNAHVATNAAGGGGGAGAPGQDAPLNQGGNGGNGINIPYFDISAGDNGWFGGGGGGGFQTGMTASQGGRGGGGLGVAYSGNASQGRDGSGGGGGGGTPSTTGFRANRGGNGVVIVRYPISGQPSDIVALGGVVTEFVGDGTNGVRDQRYRVHTFTSGRAAEQVSNASAGFAQPVAPNMGYPPDMGFAGVHKDGYLYLPAARVTNSTNFFRYDIAANTVLALAMAPQSASDGSSIIDGGDGYLYANFGGNRTELYRYSIATNIWESRTAVSVGIGVGGGMAKIGRDVYILPGRNISQLVRYNLDTGVSVNVGSLPSGSIESGGFVISDGGRYLYLSMSSDRGVDTARIIRRYDTQTDTWIRLADVPSTLTYGASGFFDNETNTLRVSQGWAWSTLYEWSASQDSYIREGTWYSKTFDVTMTDSWGDVTMDIGGGGEVATYTRSSADNKIWTNWQKTTGTAIASPGNRYLQVKVVLTGDGTETPVISNVNITYQKDTTPPSFQSRIDSYESKLKKVQIVSGTNYPHTHPYFEWQGADDGAGGSGVAGYYVYFGLDSAADPVTAGNYQYERTYEVTTPMSAGEIYYLRIKVKDKQGNISNAQTAFSYLYYYISPPGRISKTTSADFNAGANTNLAVENDAFSLNRQSTGSWATGPLSTPPVTTNASAAIVVGDYVYVVRGQGTTDFMRYSTLYQRWETLRSTPGVTSLGSLAYDGSDTLMLLYGNNSTGIARYSIASNQWSVPPTQMPQLVAAGTSMAHIGGARYAIVMGGSRNFYIYDDREGAYELKMQIPESTDSRYGASGLWYDGAGKLYGYFGYNPGTRQSLAVYDVEADYWRNLAEPPAMSFYYNQSLAYDGKGGLYLFLRPGNSDSSRSVAQNVIRYDLAADHWSMIDGFQETTTWSTVASDNERYMYILPGNSGTYTKRLVRFDTLTGEFSPSTEQIEPMKKLNYTNIDAHRTWLGGNITTAAYDGDKYIYWLGGGNETWTNFSVLAKQNRSTGETKYLTPPPLVGAGGSLGFLDGAVYYLPAKGSKYFYKLDEQTQQWNRMVDAPVAVNNPGATSLVSVNNIMYASFGAGNYYRYEASVSGGAWIKLRDVPSNVSNGSFVYSQSNNAIYVIAGNSSRNFYRYNINSDTWTTLSLLPMASAYGSTMALSGNKVYVQRGGNTAEAYMYDIAADSWSVNNDAPVVFRSGSLVVPVDETRAIVSAGESSVELWQFNMPSDTTSFSGGAQHISQPMAFEGLLTYAGVNIEATVPDDTSLQIYTRSSVDGVAWDEWAATDTQVIYQTSRRAKINSVPRHFLQIKIVLESQDNVSTPVVNGYEVDYYYDIIPPTNPSVALSYDDNAKANQLLSDKWYNHKKPHFDWPDPGEAGGATDGILGSNIAGYWVYFGVDQTAIPRTAGVYVDKSEFTADLTNDLPGVYHLRIQAQDVTANVDPEVFAPFIYKFDQVYPTNPSLVSVTPSGFTSRNNFSFQWPNAHDQHSGVAGYCYKTGATSGPFAAEICQNGTNVDGVSAAYRSGTNVFYVRAYDVAGNYSPYYTSASYYYSTDPPTPVTNLRAIPPVSDQNMFSFLWDLPVTYAGDPDLLEYCYSVNVVPSPQNTTCSKERYIAPFKAATQVGVNVLYVVAKDEAENVNWNNFTSSNFIANTASPGIPLNLSVVDTSEQESSRWALTLTWDEPTAIGNGIEGYVVERSIDGRNFDSIGRTSTRAFVDLAVTPRVLYYYRVRAADGVDNRSGPSAVIARSAVGDYPRPPKRVVEPTVGTDHTQAVISWVTDRTSTSFVEYGLTPTELVQSKGSLALDDEHKITLSGLQPSTTYYYRVQSFDLDRSYELADTFSSIYSFRTPEPARIYDAATDAVTLNAAVISWRTSVPTRTRVEYGSTLGYGLVYEDNDTELTTSHSVKLTGLESGAVYHYKVATKTGFGSSLNSDDYTFQTIARPIISDIQFQPLADEPTTSVKVSWVTNVPTTSTLYYVGSGNRQEVSTSELTTRHTISVRSLAGSTTYSMTVEGRDAFGNLGASTAQTWQSQLDTRAPMLTDKNISVSTIDGVSGKKAQIVVSWKTDEPSVSQVQYGFGSDVNYPNSTPIDTDATTEHTVIISDLNLAEIYRIQVMARDLDGNTTHGLPTTVVTPDKEVSVFDSVVGLLLRLFRVK